ncbi:D-2-hydroxyacid dehydrogenase [Myxococcota bacterium]|nr:D-2-hydroxyacid dehydrogenase [Myxococcota bacterium]
MPDSPIVVCLGYPDLLEPEYTLRVEAIDSRFQVVGLPVDPDGEWLTVPPAEPHPEPPPWARSVEADRKRALAKCEILISLHTPRNLPALAPQLRWIQGMGAGVEQFARAGVTSERVRLTNASGLASASMAEFVIGRLLAFWKRFPEQAELQKRHEYTQTYGRTFSGSTVGIVGFGSIGREVAKRARALGCRVVGVRRSHEPGQTSPHADILYGVDGLHELLEQSDAVIVSAPATEETRHLISAKELACMQRGTILVNVARGSLLDEAALTRSLMDGHLGGAALDVFEQEPLPPDSPLWDLPNVLLSAHSSVSTDRYVDDAFELFLDNLGRYASAQPLRNQVDMDALGFAPQDPAGKAEETGEDH